MGKKYSILFIEDSQDDLELLLHWIKSHGISFGYKHVQSAPELKEILKTHQFDIVISDFKMPSFTGFDALKIVLEFDKDIPFILVSGSIGEELAVNAMRVGCKDYIMKENLSRLVPSIERELVDAESRKQLRKAEVKIEKEAQVLNSIYAALPSGVGMIKDQKVLWVNDKLFEITGYTRDDIINKTSRFLYETEEEFIRVKTEVDSLIRQHGVGSTQSRWKCKDNRWIDVIITSTPMDIKDETKGFIFSITDISGQKEVEGKLLKSESKFEKMQEKLPIGIYRTTMGGNLLYANKVLQTLLGISENGGIDNVNMSRFYKNPGARKEFVKRFLKEQVVKNFETCLIQSNGNEILVSISGQIVDSENDEQIIDGVVIDITEQKKAQANLKDSEEKHRIMMESMHDAVYICSPDYRIEYLNPAMKKMLGGDFVGEFCYKAVFKRDSECENCVFDEIRKGESVKKDLIHPFNDRIYSCVHSPIIKNNGEVSKMAIYRDVTESRFAQREIQIQREYFEGLFNNSPDAIVILDEEDKIIRINNKFTELFEYSQSDCEGKAVNDLLVPDKLKNEGKEATHTVATGQMVDIDTIRKTKSNKEINVSVKGNPFTLPDGKKVVYAIYRDISQRVKDHQIIKLNESRLEGLLELSEHKAGSVKEMLDYTLEGAIKLTNSKIGYIYHYYEKEQKFVLNSWSGEVMKECSVMDPQTEYMLEKTGFWGEAVRQRKPILSNDFHIPDSLKKGYPQGHVYLERFLTIPVFFENEIVAVVGVANKESDYNDADIRQLRLLMDSVWKILERKKFVEELSLAKIKAEESDRLKSAFLANISHEIRTPMNAILGFSQLLSMADISEKEKEEFISLINSRGTDLMRIIEDIIAVSDIEAGHVTLEMKEIFLTDFMKKMELRFQNNKLLVENVNLDLEFISKRRLSNALHIYSDEEKLHMILFNLVENALKFTSAGKVEVGFNIRENNSGMIEFFVKDTGIGIIKSKQEQIFNIFRQVEEDHTREYGGTGLGLAISKRFVENMGGKIWVESEINEGSTFFFTIPHYIKDEEVLKMVVEQKNGFDDIWKGKCILVVEDNPVNFMFIDRVLSRTGVKTYRATDGKEAVEIYAMVKNIDLVLMDINLPKKSGFEATAEMKNFNPNIPIIAQTAYSMPRDENIEFGPEFDAIIKKPYTPDQLIEVISELLF